MTVAAIDITHFMDCVAVENGGMMLRSMPYRRRRAQSKPSRRARRQSGRTGAIAPKGRPGTTSPIGYASMWPHEAFDFLQARLDRFRLDLEVVRDDMAELQEKVARLT